MAFTVTPVITVFGNKSVRILNIQADAAEANVDSGFSVIEACVVGRISSMGTANAYVQFNKNSSGTAANGTIGVSGVSSGAEFQCIVFGR
jgi:hypothetical protein